MPFLAMICLSHQNIDLIYCLRRQHFKPYEVQVSKSGLKKKRELFLQQNIYGRHSRVVVSNDTS